MPDHKIEIHSYNGPKPFAFISYSHDDLDTISEYLNAADENYRLWYDEGIKSGAEYIMKRIMYDRTDSTQLRMNKALFRNELQKLLLLNNKYYTPTVIDFIETDECSSLIMSEISGINLRDLLLRRLDLPLGRLGFLWGALAIHPIYFGLSCQ